MLVDAPRTSPDGDLLAAARTGCPDACATLYERHRDSAVAAARRVLASTSPSLAEDAVHTAFIEVFRALRNGRGPTDDLRPYLVTAVRRHAVRLLRNPHVAALDLEEIAAADPPSQSIGEGRLTASGLSDHELLTSAVAQLPPRLRTVLWALEVEGFGAREVAAHLGIKPSEVYVLRYRARRRLVRTYVNAYQDHAADGCRTLISEIEAFLLTAKGEGAASPELAAHTLGCSPCRDLLRGVDLPTS